MNTIPLRIIKDDVSIVLCGEAGQGIQTVERLLTPVLKLAGCNVFACKEYMSRVRGGSNSTEIRVTSTKKTAYVERIDILIPLDKDAIPHLGKRITGSTIIIGDKEKLATDRDVIDIPFAKIAADVGGVIYANTVAIGLLMGLLKIDLAILDKFLGEFFKKKSKDIIDKNIEAGKRGYALAKDLAGPGKIDINIRQHPEVKNEMLATGAEILAAGAIAGGCNFIAAYPMTPSTGILTFLSQHAHEFGIISEQAEDEISAINMAIGAWYAGARAMTATAGGGFALMVEGLSLAGMLESPVVVSVGMRPAPATGLPTRTEQGDLEHVLYSGHGEFPRIVLAPRSVEDAYFIMAKAFNLADKYQCPVIVLSDQYLVDSYYNTPVLDTTKVSVQSSVVQTKPSYKRYALSDNGISPRGIPGYGEGLVCVDSDEHDEEGHITESMDVRKSMVDKRLKKLALIENDCIAPELAGPKEYETLVVAWGSNYGVIKEALENIGADNVSFLHFNQVYPVHADAARYLKKTKRVIMVENNATGQFARVLQLHTGVAFEHKILKYDGMPFSVEEMTARLKNIIGKERAAARVG